MLRVLFGSFCCFFLIFRSEAALDIDNYTPATNDRFANSPSFFADSYDLSGIGRDDDMPLTGFSGGHWVTMISPNVFLTARHFAPALNHELTFYPNNDPNGGAVVRTLAGLQVVNGFTDLVVGHLSTPLPSTIKTYGFATTPLSEATFSGSAYSDAHALLTGVSPTTTGYGSSVLTNSAHGENRIESFSDGFTLGGSTGDVILTVKNQPGDAIFGYTYENYEADVNPGDSGGPIFRTLPNNELEIAGIAWASGTGDIAPGISRDVSIYTYTGNYATQIQNYIDAHPVPEPSSSLLLTIATMFFLRRAR